MKKILALLLALVMATCLLTACGEGDATTGSSSATGSQPAQGGEGTSDGDKKVLTMGTNAAFAPYEYVDENGKYVGIDVEIAQAIADKLGMTLEIEDMEFDSIVTSVKTGAVDFGMAGMTVTENRKKEVDFTNTYATGKQVVIVIEGGKVNSLDGLAEAKIGVQRGTTGDVYATGDYGMNEDKVTENGKVVRYDNGNQAVLALISGAVDAVIIDNEPAKSLVAANDGKGLSILETEYVYEEYAICVNKDNAELLSKINTAIDALMLDGTIDGIIEKYIPSQPSEQ